ncbi:MAG: hypothetical protein KIT22_04105 [Verrucomicrobiae bacterium]|nr:hypothetical protein [Verrucomicrobiae bacterium]
MVGASLGSFVTGSIAGKPGIGENLLGFLGLVLGVIPALAYHASRKKICPRCGGPVIPVATPIGRQLALGESRHRRPMISGEE